MVVKIIQEGNPVLRKKAKKVPLGDIKTPEMKKILKQMKEALASQADGVAIAAPQIGVSLRIFVVSGRIFDDTFARGKGVPDGHTVIEPDLVFINPEIIKLSKKAKWLDEGCLSVRPLYGQVKRSLNATVRAYDENGIPFVRGGGGLLAHIFQHETDHLDGILFIDKARDVHEVEEMKVALKKNSKK